MNPSIFNFNEHGVRVTLDSNNEPLFCLADICKALDIKNQNPKRFNLNLKGLHKMSSPTSSGIQTLTFISEENLYRIVFRSNKAEALNFQNWVFAEVLPTIRKTGSYSARQTAFDELNRLCMEEKVSKDKGSFHSHGMHRRKREKHKNAIRIQTCRANIELSFEGLHND
ncbi:Bro-N domain-containing protein [Acinetobacter sp. ULE_I046]|uniref:BRO-N domain-containing protein n=1 Tax=Acinetobacter sp. ULE_I046 TaxID=3373068 RepID=UPI003AF68D32